MYDFLDRLRARPIAERKQIALMTSGGITALITLVWASVAFTSPSLSVSISPNGQEAAALNAFAGGATSMIEVLDKAGDIIDETKDAIAEGPPRPESVTTDAWGNEVYPTGDDAAYDEYTDSYTQSTAGDTLTTPGIDREEYEASVQNPYGPKSSNTTKAASPSVTNTQTGGGYVRPSKTDL